MARLQPIRGKIIKGEKLSIEEITTLVKECAPEKSADVLKRIKTLSHKFGTLLTLSPFIRSIALGLGEATEGFQNLARGRAVLG
jgi:hypothetical protein